MFGKLLKYDFRSMFKQFAFIWPAALVLEIAESPENRVDIPPAPGHNDQDGQHCHYHAKEGGHHGAQQSSPRRPACGHTTGPSGPSSV